MNRKQKRDTRFRDGTSKPRTRATNAPGIVTRTYGNLTQSENYNVYYKEFQTINYPSYDTKLNNVNKSTTGSTKNSRVYHEEANSALLRNEATDDNFGISLGKFYYSVLLNAETDAQDADFYVDYPSVEPDTFATAMRMVSTSNSRYVNILATEFKNGQTDNGKILLCTDGVRITRTAAWIMYNGYMEASKSIMAGLVVLSTIVDASKWLQRKFSFLDSVVAPAVHTNYTANATYFSSDQYNTLVSRIFDLVADLYINPAHVKPILKHFNLFEVNDSNSFPVVEGKVQFTVETGKSYSDPIVVGTEDVKIPDLYTKVNATWANIDSIREKLYSGAQLDDAQITGLITTMIDLYNHTKANAYPVDELIMWMGTLEAHNVIKNVHKTIYDLKSLLSTKLVPTIWEDMLNNLWIGSQQVSLPQGVTYNLSKQEFNVYGNLTVTFPDSIKQFNFLPAYGDDSLTSALQYKTVAERGIVNAVDIIVYTKPKTGNNTDWRSIGDSNLGAYYDAYTPFMLWVSPAHGTIPPATLIDKGVGASRTEILNAADKLLLEGSELSILSQTIKRAR